MQTFHHEDISIITIIYRQVKSTGSHMHARKSFGGAQSMALTSTPLRRRPRLKCCANDTYPPQVKHVLVVGAGTCLFKFEHSPMQLCVHSLDFALEYGSLPWAKSMKQALIDVLNKLMHHNLVAWRTWCRCVWTYKCFAYPPGGKRKKGRGSYIDYVSELLSFL